MKPARHTYTCPHCTTTIGLEEEERAAGLGAIIAQRRAWLDAHPASPRWVAP